MPGLPPAEVQAQITACSVLLAEERGLRPSSRGPDPPPLFPSPWTEWPSTPLLPPPAGLPDCVPLLQGSTSTPSVLLRQGPTLRCGCSGSACRFVPGAFPQWGEALGVHCQPRARGSEGVWELPHFPAAKPSNSCSHCPWGLMVQTSHSHTC